MERERIQTLVDWIEDQVGFHQPSSIFDFLLGLESFANSFAICKDGEKCFGSQEYTTRELAEALRVYDDKQE